MIDADIQPMLSSFFATARAAPHSLKPIHTIIDHLDIVVSDDPQAKPPDRIRRTANGRFRLKYAFDALAERNVYDIVLIDTSDAAVLATNKLFSPVPPEMFSSREFLRGTAEELYRLQFKEERLTTPGFHLGRPGGQPTTSAGNVWRRWPTTRPPTFAQRWNWTRLPRRNSFLHGGRPQWNRANSKRHLQMRR